MTFIFLLSIESVNTKPCKTGHTTEGDHVRRPERGPSAPERGPAEERGQTSRKREKKTPARPGSERRKRRTRTDDSLLFPNSLSNDLYVNTAKVTKPLRNPNIIFTD